MLLGLLYQFAAKGAAADGDAALAAELRRDADDLAHHLSQRAALACGGVAGNA